MVERGKQAARDLGPPTSEEIETLSKLHWREVDCPPPMLVVHVVVLRRGKLPDAGVDTNVGLPLAERLRTSLVDVSDRRLRSAREGAARARPLVVTSAWNACRVLSKMVDRSREAKASDEQFAKGAAAIANVGGTSPVVESSFGWHVIRLLERQPARRIPYEMRGQLFEPEVMATRAQKEHEKLIIRLRREHPVGIANGAVSMTDALFTTSPQ